jgi:hypothetical protein
MATEPPAREPDEPPPFLGSWRAVYALVLGGLVLLIIACSVVAAVYR